MMAIGTKFAVACFESIINKKERELLSSTLTTSRRIIIPISIQQMNSFCGNILEVRTKDQKLAVVMSQTAYDSFTREQLRLIQESCDKLIVSSIPTVEKYGGGGIRCMLAESFS
jgi:hypothetical protein